LVINYKIKNRLRTIKAENLLKVSTASLNSEFTGSYKKGSYKSTKSKALCFKLWHLYYQ